MNKINEFENALKRFDLKYVKEKSQNVFILDKINNECLMEHQRKYLQLEKDETPIFILNGKKNLISKLIPFTGFVITNKNFHFTLLKNSFFTGIIPFREKPRYLPLKSINDFQIGEHDACFGTAYVGHDLMINNQSLGLVRLGFSVTYEEKALEYINAFSQFLFEEGFLNNAPKNFDWQ